MRSRKFRAAGVLTAIGLVAASGLAGEAVLAAPPGTVIHYEDAQRAFDTLAGSGTAGIDPALAQAITQQQDEQLTGDIAFSEPHGTFEGQLTVELSTTVDSDEIRYTTDGLVPTASSDLYGEPLLLAETTQLRAQAFLGGEPAGEMGTAVYIARSGDAQHDLPLVVIDAYGGGPPPREFRDMAVMLMEPQGGVASLSQEPAVATRGGFRLRGQSSAGFDKTPYRLEFWDNDDRDADYPVFGMPADADWVLRGPYPDKSLIRDALAYSLGRDLGLKAPRFTAAEVYVNLDGGPLSEEHYQGVYMLQENLQISPHRLDLAELEETDLTEPNISGGYQLQFNAGATEEPVLQCTPPTQGPDDCWSELELQRPNNVVPEQIDWITNYVQQFHDALRSDNPSDPNTGYPAYIDVGSFVDRIIHNELGLQGDSYIRSTHFYKDREGPLVAGPLWDYDLAFGTIPGFGGGGPVVSGWQFQAAGRFGTTDWFIRLMEDPEFHQQVVARWQEVRTGPLSDAELNARVAALSAPLANAAERNFERWPILQDDSVGFFRTVVTETWQEQIDYLANFLILRAAWIDESGWDLDQGGTAFPPGPGPGPGGGSE